MNPLLPGPENALDDLRVLVTRPEASQQVLIDAIAAAGGQAVSLPMLRILPLREPQARQRARTLVQDLDNFDLLIFISRNAVLYGCQLIDEFWPQFPIGPRLFAIGPATAELLGATLGQPVENSTAGMDSESLLALPAFDAVRDLKIAIIRGVGGRELLAETLREKGARVHYLESYLREAVHYPGEDVERALNDNDVNTIVVNSLDTLEALLACGRDDLPVQTNLEDRRVSSLSSKIMETAMVVPSARIAKAAEDRGIQKVYLSAGADTVSILNALSKRRKDL